jgi:(p)ppGpp synthase/HD superfamily hydrolase
VSEGRAAHPDLGESVEIMRKAHEGQLDKCGRPYYLHPLRVAMRLIHCTPEERHAALLHDVVEDTPLTLGDLRAFGYSDDVIELVDLLTRRMPEGESHRQYLERIVSSRDARALRVKLADVIDNMSPARTAALPAEHRGMHHRFARDLQRIAEALRALGDELSGTIVRGDL